MLFVPRCCPTCSNRRLTGARYAAPLISLLPKSIALVFSLTSTYATGGIGRPMTTAMSPSFCHIFRLSQNLNAGRLPACEDFDCLSSFDILDLALAKPNLFVQSGIGRYREQVTSLAFLRELFP